MSSIYPSSKPKTSCQIGCFFHSRLSWVSETTSSTVSLLVENVVKENIQITNPTGTLVFTYSTVVHRNKLKAVIVDEYGCTDSSDIETSTLLKPEADLQVDYLSTKDLLVSCRFEDKSLNHTSSQLFYGDGNSDFFSPNFSENYQYLDIGIFTASLVVSNKDICVDTATEHVVVLPEVSFYIPTVISPNGDKLNDYLNFSTRLIADFEVDIYNRWGEKVMHIEKVEQLHLTSELTQGVYLVTYGIKDIFNKYHHISQNLTVLR